MNLPLVLNVRKGWTLGGERAKVCRNIPLVPKSHQGRMNVGGVGVHEPTSCSKCQDRMDAGG